jgi:RimJ/RimL family protein N-acetyltransferase
VVGGLSFENGGHRRIAHRGSLGVSVRQAWRGQGIGAALIAALIAWAEASPLIEKIGLSVFADNAGAIRLYQWLGFVEEGRRSGEMKLGPGQYADEVLMCRWTNRGDAASAADRALHEAALLSEAALGEDWNRPEEDAAWSHLQSGN